MKKVLLTAACFGLMVGCSESNEKPTSMSEHNTATEQAIMTTRNTASEPPRAQKIDHFMSIHGDKRNDEYYWLRDDTRQNKAVLDSVLLNLETVCLMRDWIRAIFSVGSYHGFCIMLHNGI